MNKLEGYNKINYGKKTHDIRCHIDMGLEDRINSGLEKLNAAPYMKLKKADFLRLALETFCGEVLSGEFEMGITFRTKDKCVGRENNGKK